MTLQPTPSGEPYTRREALQIFGSILGALGLTACGLPSGGQQTLEIPTPETGQPLPLDVIKTLSAKDQLLYFNQGGLASEWVGLPRPELITQTANYLYPLTAREFEVQTGIKVEPTVTLAYTTQEYIENLKNSGIDELKARDLSTKSLATSYVDHQGQVRRLFNLDMLNSLEAQQDFPQPGQVATVLISYFFHEYCHFPGTFKQHPGSDQLGMLDRWLRQIAPVMSISLTDQNFLEVNGFRVYYPDAQNPNQSLPILGVGFDEAMRAKFQELVYQHIGLGNPCEMPNNKDGAALISYVNQKLGLTDDNLYLRLIALAKNNAATNQQLADEYNVYKLLSEYQDLYKAAYPNSNLRDFGIIPIFQLIDSGVTNHRAFETTKSHIDQYFKP